MMDRKLETHLKCIKSRIQNENKAEIHMIVVFLFECTCYGYVLYSDS